MKDLEVGGGFLPESWCSTSVPRAGVPQVSHLESWCHTNVINKVHAVLPGGNGDDEEDNDGNGGGFNHFAIVTLKQGHWL